MRTLTSRSQCTACEQSSPSSPFPPVLGAEPLNGQGGTCVWSTFCIWVSLTRVTVTGASSSIRLQRSSFGLLISRRQRSCAKPGGAPSVSLRPPGVTEAPRGETEPLPLEPRGFSWGWCCPRQRWHLCFVLFAVPCLALGSLTCSHTGTVSFLPSCHKLGLLRSCSLRIMV